MRLEQVLLVVVVAGMVGGQHCTQIREECRLRTERSQLHGRHHVSLNISCYCKYDKDVSGLLEELGGLKCSWLPYTQDMAVDLSVLHLVGCSLQEKKLPRSVLQLVRRSLHLKVHVERSSHLRLATFRHEETVIPALNATFLDSKLSGIPDGVLGGAQNVWVTMKRCEVKVLEARAFSNYPPTANVHISLLDTIILTLKMAAFHLPASGMVNFTGGKVLAWESSGYSGGSHLSLHGVNIGRLLSGAINIEGLQSFSMINCTVAELYKTALRDRTLPQPRSLHEQETSAIFVGNNFIMANGRAFVELCSKDRLLWKNNTFASMTVPPLRLQEPECETERDWHNIISFTGINCSNCEDFRNPDAQSCAVYETGYCTTCKEHLDGCNFPILSRLILGECSVSHPSMATELEAVCNFNRSTIKPASRSLDSGGMMLAYLSLWVLVGGFVVETCVQI